MSVSERCIRWERARGPDGGGGAGIIHLACGVKPRMRAVVAILFALFGAAQAQEFEVASIRPSAPDSPTFMQAHPGGRLDVSRATLRALMALAWRVQSYQVEGGPVWVRSEYFNVSAKAASNPDEATLLLMIRSLLKERFSLKLHTETRVAPVYFLVVDGNGTKPTPGLKVAADASAPGEIGMGQNHVEAHGISISRLAEALSMQLDRKVVAKTGRSGKFDIALRWTPDAHQATISSTDVADVPADAPALFTAIREQLGLKLKPGKAPVQFIVIDGAEKPTAN